MRKHVSQKGQAMGRVSLQGVFVCFETVLVPLSAEVVIANVENSEEMSHSDAECAHNERSKHERIIRLAQIEVWQCKVLLLRRLGDEILHLCSWFLLFACLSRRVCTRIWWSLRSASSIRLHRACQGKSYFLDGYCATVQGLLDWFEVDLIFTKLRFFRLIFLLSVFCVSYVTSRSPLVLCGRLALPSPRGGSASRVIPQSCQSHGSLWGPCSSLCCAQSKDHLLHFLNDRADDSSIHRGTYHILEST